MTPAQRSPHDTGRALVLLLLTALVLAPFVRDLVDRSGRFPVERGTSTPAEIERFTKAARGTGDPPSGPPSVLRLRVVPAVRDLQVEIDGTRYGSDAEGRIEAPTLGHDASVEVLGYEVTPSFQSVRFTGWADGKVDPSRTMAATGTDATTDLGVEISYRVTVDAPPAAPVTLDSTTAQIAIIGGDPTWVPAAIAVPGPAGTLEAASVPYQPTIDGRPVGPEVIPTPEALIDLRIGT